MTREDAIEIMRKNMPSDKSLPVYEAIQTLVPELAESEDEKIRKEMIRYFTEMKKGGSAALPYDDCIAYLEKQKVNVKDKVRVVSWRSPDDCSDIPEGHYVVIAYNPGVFGLGYIANGKVVAAPNNKPQAIFYIPNADESVVIEQKPEWSEDDDATLSWCISDIERAKYCKSQTKPELCDIEINWLKSLPERFNLQPKQEWSEEDRQCFDEAIEALESLGFDGEASNLKSLRNYRKPLNTWKPAEWSNEDEKMRNALWSLLKIQYAQDYSMTGVGIEAGKFRNWLNSLPKDSILQPKQEWSKGDEENFEWFDKFFRAESVVAGGKDIPQDKYLWFKSLRPSWKPSDEQPEMNIPSAGSGAMGTTPPKFKLDVKQDLPVGLEKEIKEYLEKLGGGHGGFVDDLTDDDLTGFARHFYKLGLKARKL